MIIETNFNLHYIIGIFKIKLFYKISGNINLCNQKTIIDKCYDKNLNLVYKYKEYSMLRIFCEI